VKDLKVTLQLLPIVLALEKTSMKTTRTHITEGRMYATEEGKFLKQITNNHTYP
jgi:hypothetical protein